MTRRDDLEFADQYREFDRETFMEEAGYETMPFGEDSIPSLYGTREDRELYQEDGESWPEGAGGYRADEYAGDRYEEFGQDRYEELGSDRFWENTYETPGYELPGYETPGYELSWGETDQERDEFFNFRKALKFLKPLAKVAVPMIGTALGGPVGGLVGTAASALLREGRDEGGWNREQGLQLEAAYSPSLEWHLETPLSAHQQLAESLAAAASQAQSDREADAMTGAAVTMSLTPAQRAELRHLLRATTTLTRLMRRRRDTRVLMRVVPTLVSQTASTLVRARADGRAVTPATVGNVMAAQTRRILQPAAASKVVTRSIQASRRVNTQPRDARGRFASVRG